MIESEQSTIGLGEFVTSPSQVSIPSRTSSKTFINSPVLLRSQIPRDRRLATELFNLAQTPQLQAPGLQISPNLQRVGVRILTNQAEQALLELTKIGFELTGIAAKANLIEGFIPISALNQLESIPNILSIATMPLPRTSTGSINSQADLILEAERVRSTLPSGINGTGVSIGVLSDSFDRLGGATAGRSSGDLPLVTILAEGSSGSDEGRAMIELIHDLAPGAEIFFATGALGELAFAQRIRDLAAVSDILVDDLYYLEEPMFQDGIIAQAISEVVTNQSTAYFSAAGNFGQQAYESGSFTTVTDNLLGVGQIFAYDFDPGVGVDTRQGLFLAAGQTLELVLQWDDPFYTLNGVDTDLDLFLVRADTGAIVASSIRNNLINQTPVETIIYNNDTNATTEFELVIQLVAGANPNRIKYVNYGSDRFGAIGITEYATSSGTIVPHATVPEAKSVGAVPYFNQTIAQGFTSAGPSTILFSPTGSPIPLQVRNEPDFAALDGVDNTFFGTDNDTNGKPNFFGTSAAVAHAAAIAALVKQANPGFTPSQIYDRIESTATDIDAPGRDRLTGAGLINAYDAVFGEVIPASINFSDGLERGALSISYDTSTNRAGQIQVTTTDGVNSALRHVTLDSSLNGVSSRNELILHFDATGKNNVQLSFLQREFGDEDQPMPANFVGSRNFDGVALSVDGNNWFRIVSLTGSASTEIYQFHQFDLSAIAATNNISLGADTRVKFQQFDDFGIDFSQTPAASDGFAFDFISITTDSLNGNSTNNILNGNSNPDLIFGLAGSDRINGGAGNDTLVGGLGRDILFGGSDSDIFQFELADSILGTGSIPAPDRMAEFSQISGDRFRILPDNPSSLFNYGTVTASTLPQALSAIYADKDQNILGAQPLLPGESILLTYGGRTYLSVNDGISSFSDSSDLVVEILTFSYAAGDNSQFMLSIPDYFI